MIRAFALGLATCLGLDTSTQAQQPPPTPRTDFEVLARGPVHEAFAIPVDGLVAPTQAVTPAPPPPLDERIPAERPAGGPEWVGGYWFWNEDTTEYLWVSGCWRAPPPGREWLPGQWVKAADGYYWVGGGWLPQGRSRLQLLPPPPAMLEEKAGSPPDASSMFVQGTWVWEGGKYAWRPGRWVAAPAGWVWQPDHFVWTPAGYLFVDGYWDAPLDGRGLLYAPVGPPQKPGAYTPQYVVRPAFLMQALFARAESKHYFFGDYFERPNLSAGYIPWFDYRTSRTSFDPLFTYYAIHKPAEGWDKRLREVYEERYAARAPRPPRTLALQQPGAVKPPTEGGAAVATDPQDFALAPANRANRVGMRLDPLSADQKAKFQAAVKDRAAAVRTNWDTPLSRLVEKNQGAPPKAPIEMKLPPFPPPAGAETARRQPPPPLPHPPLQAITPPTPTLTESGLPGQPARPIPPKKGP